MPTPTNWPRAYDNPVYFAESVLGVTLHDGQKRWLENSYEPENLLVTGNRWGKSFVCAIKLLHHALFRPHATDYDLTGRFHLVTASITQDQANIIFNQVLRFIRHAGNLDGVLASVVHTPYPTITFLNDSVIEARSTQNRGEYLLGHSYDLFIFDEVAFETDPEYVVEEIVTMRLADRQGRLDLVSTPNGRNWFHRRFRELTTGKRPGYTQSGDSRENIFISRAFLDERMTYFSEHRVQQNILGKFVDSGGEILRGNLIDHALAPTPGPNPDEREGRGLVSRPPSPCHCERSEAISTTDISTNPCCLSFPRKRETTVPLSGVEACPPTPRFLTGWDLARKRTHTVGITIEFKNDIARVVALDRFRNEDWTVVVEKIKARQLQYAGDLIPDSTGIGDVVLDQLSEFNPTPFIFTQRSKIELLTNVELFHARRRIRYDRWELPDGPGRTWSLEDELRAARWDDNNECDALMALGLALWPLRTRAAPIILPRLGKA